MSGEGLHSKRERDDEESPPNPTSNKKAVHDSSSDDSSSDGTETSSEDPDEANLSQEELIQKLKAEVKASKKETKAWKKETKAWKKETKASKKEAKASKKEAKASKKEAKASKKEAKAAKQVAEAAERLRKNTSMESLMAVPEGRFELAKIGGPQYSNVAKKSHRQARTEPKQVDLLVPTQTAVETPIVSKLLQLFVDQKHVGTPELRFNLRTYYSEADITTFVRAALDDAINLVTEEHPLECKNLRTMMERSLFGCRADMMAIRDDDQNGFLAVEVKQPLQMGKVLTDYPLAIGHGFDQAHAMDAFGQGNGLVLMTTFDESRLCAVKEGDLNEDDDEAMSVDHGRTDDLPSSQPPPKLQSPISKTCREEIGRTVSDESPRSSKSSESKSDIVELWSGERGAPSISTLSESNSYFVELGTGERVLYVSQLIKSHELVKLAYTALTFAIKNSKRSTQRMHKLTLGKTYSMHALRAVEGNLKENVRRRAKYYWGNLDFTMGQKITCKEQMDGRREENESYYIIGMLGRGVTSNVYQALDPTGKEVALKVYVQCFDDEDKPMKDNEFLAKAKAATKVEKERLDEFYPFLKGEVQVTKLFGMWCVVMPVFRPVEKGDRAHWLPKIANVLQKTFEPMGKKYSDGDVRWRHVGKYNDKEGAEHCVLFDLENLEDTSPSDSFVQEHYNIFDGRKGTDV
jgi:hypothetical protein